MRRVLVWVLMVALLVGGLIGTTAYLVALVVTSDRLFLTNEYGAVFAFSVVGLFAGLVSILALLDRLPRRLTLPGEWLALVAFLAAVGAGIGVMITGRFFEATPFLALIATAALFGFIARLITRWSPEDPVGTRGFAMPAIWGMIGAPVLAVFAQLATVVMLIGGGVAGLYLADASLIDNVESWITEVTETADLSVIETPTVTFAALALLGVAAPLSEELTKFLGVYILFRNRVATKYGLFLAGAAAGLGFAVVETLGYALMSGEAWPQIMLLRAPVALIHVAATSIVALGWYRQRQNGGQSLVLFFLLAVLLHAAWNSLFVSMVIVAAGIDTADTIDPVAGLLVLAAVSAMGAVMIATVFWIVGNARRLGRESRPMDETTFAPGGLQPVAGSQAYTFRP
jgi:RsiW-degrading membrane proteinase PrsW (M82 family)